MGVIGIDECIKQIKDKVQSGRVALFLGAGASQASMGPSGAHLTDLVRKKFPEIDQNIAGFIDVCQEVIDTPPYDRKQLADFIRDQLRILKPSAAHREMVRHNWTTIFTTNFDDLIELAFRNSEDTRRKVQTISKGQFSISPFVKDKLFVFKIMGCMSVEDGSDGAMVLSRADYNKALVRRQNYLRTLRDMIKEGTVVFVGYGFDDRIVLDVIDELKEGYREDCLPWSYTLCPNFDLTSKLEYRFSSRRIIPVEGSYEEFMKHLGEEVEPLQIGAPRELQHIALKNFEIDIDSEVYTEHFEILTKERLERPSGEKDDFLKGINVSWGAFRKNWDFLRDIYIGPADELPGGTGNERPLRKEVRVELENQSRSRMILLTGMPGVGKTMLLRRIAYDVADNRLTPVFVIKSLSSEFDFKLLSSLIEDINKKIDEKVGMGKHAAQLKPLIIIDDAAAANRHIEYLSNYLESRGRKSLIICAERKGAWQTVKSKHLLTFNENDVFELDESLTANEKKRIIRHFSDLGYIDNPGIAWGDIIQKEFDNSFFATIYTLVDPSKRPLNTIIKEQYNDLREQSRKAFRFICSLHQFNLELNLELLLRALKCDFQTLYRESIDQDAAKIIFEEQDELGNVVFKTHHRIIARKTVEFFFGDPEEQKTIFVELLRDVNLSITKEKDIVANLLINYIGPNAKNHGFSYAQQQQIFETVGSASPVRSIVHHWGILEADNKQYEQAERLLRQALDLPRETAGGREEADQTILTSLGNVYAHIAADKFLSDGIASNEYVDKAEKCFRDARSGEYPNSHAYHAHANMWYVKGKISAEKDCFVRALEVIERGKDNVNENTLEPLIELEGMIWREIGNEREVEKIQQLLQQAYGSIRGYSLSAMYYLRRAEQDERTRGEFLELAVRMVDEALNIKKNDESCLSLKAKIVGRKADCNIRSYHEVLNQWYQCYKDSNVSLMFEFAWVTFVLGYYKKSQQVFAELSNCTVSGYARRSRPTCPIVDGKKSMKVFQGAISRIRNIHSGDISCHSLRNLNYPVFFRPIAAKFSPREGDLVEFNIAFNFRGPVALNVKKV